MSEEQADDLVIRADAAGDAQAWGAALLEHQDRLQRMAAFRLDPRLRGRIDASDIVQEAFLQASSHRQDYLRTPSLPLFLWLRGIVGNKLLELHRHHLGTRMRDAGREIDPRARCSPDATSQALAAELSGHATGPRTAAARAEVKAQLQSALASMEAIDREVLALRHFEQLSNDEAAQVLGIQERAAAKRYVRALKRLKELLAEMPGGLTGLRP
jgi:RNA polymerase sigma-70 factor (ECF subfamily)